MSSNLLFISCISRMSATCFKKCVVNYHDGELAVGELACIDRCIGKYLMAQNKVGEVLNAFDQQLKAQEQAKQSIGGLGGTR